RREVSYPHGSGITEPTPCPRSRVKAPFSITELAQVAELLELTLGDLLGRSILQARRSPHTELVGAGASGGLLRLDSNQQPFDYSSRSLANHTVAATLRLVVILMATLKSPTDEGHVA
uniref:hypothetical protein n=1 Tax=uncultured Micrococcus sp. TaxID=114051 RepID=UPI0026129621